MSLTFHVLNPKLLLSLLVTTFLHHFAFATSKPNGLSLKAVPDDSPDSPLYRIANLTRAKRIEKFIQISYAKANYTILALNPNGVVVPDDIRIPMYRNTLFYAVGFTIGSQQHYVRLLMDTGGGLTWTQCQPCTNCFPQNLPIYDSRASTSYTMLPCDHPLCSGNGSIYSCINDLCMYNVAYGGGGITSGVASLETFQFFIDAQRRSNFDNVIFGCSYDNHNIQFQNTDISGIFGLSFAPDSMAVQFRQISNGRFSYCLVPFRDVILHPILLRFGNDIPWIPPQLLRSTPFVERPGSAHFYLQLLDISVAGYRLGFRPYTFNFRPNGQGGCIIDSGALLSVIDSGTIGVNAYAEVMSVFATYYGTRNLRRITTGLGASLLCYQHPPNYNDFASITFHFNGADYTIDGQYGHVFHPGFFCVGILQENSLTILGAWHQQNKRLIYDMWGRALRFVDEQCANDV